MADCQYIVETEFNEAVFADAGSLLPSLDPCCFIRLCHRPSRAMHRAFSSRIDRRASWKQRSTLWPDCAIGRVAISCRSCCGRHSLCIRCSPRHEFTRLGHGRKRLSTSPCVRERLRKSLGLDTCLRKHEENRSILSAAALDAGEVQPSKRSWLSSADDDPRHCSVDLLVIWSRLGELARIIKAFC